MILTWICVHLFFNTCYLYVGNKNLIDFFSSAPCMHQRNLGKWINSFGISQIKRHLKNTSNSNAAITKANLDGIKEISQNQIHLRASESSSVADAGPGGEALNMAVFPDKHCRAWGGFRQTGELEAVCRGLRGEADWINSSLRLSCSLRGHQGNMEGKWRGFIPLSQDCWMFAY